MSPARANAPGKTFCCSGATYTDWGTQPRNSANPQAVSPRSSFTSGAAAITIRYGVIGFDSRQRDNTRRRSAIGNIRDSSNAPLATTVCPRGAVTIQLMVAF